MKLNRGHKRVVISYIAFIKSLRLKIKTLLLLLIVGQRLQIVRIKMLIFFVLMRDLLKII